MSSVALCLFSVALCNVGVLEQSLFDQQHVAPQNQQHQQQQQQQGGFYGQATNFANQGLGLFGVNVNQNQNPNRQQQGQKPKHPPNPCGKKFQYVTDGNMWKGVIRIKNIDLTRDFQLEVDFAIPNGRNVSETSYLM